MPRPVSAPRGTRDLLPEDGAAWSRVEGIARDLSRRYAFERIETPLFERIELFSRGGQEILKAIERQRHAVLGRRPAISKSRRLALVARAVLGKLLGSRV